MAVDPRLLLAGRPTDVGASFGNALLNVQRLEQIQQQRQQQELNQQLQPLRDRLLQSQVTSAEQGVAGQPLRDRLLTAQTATAEQGVSTPSQLLDARNTARLTSIAQFSQQALPRLAAGDIEGTRALLQQRRQGLVESARQGERVDTTEVDEALKLLDSNPKLLAQRMQQSIDAFRQLQAPTESAGQREFESLIAGFTPKQKEQARLTKARIIPAAVGSAAQTIAELGTAEDVGASEAIIRERVKFAELTGASRGKAIDKGFERIGKITTNINNLDRAIRAVEAGAGTGAIERRFPSIKAASVELDQIQGQLALDVIGAVTFGALSQGELDLAKQIALPTGLDGPQLIAHLQERKSAQSKLLNYFQEQIDFLDRGGSVASFLREKRRQAQGSQQPAAAQPQDTATPAGATQVGRFTVEAE